jgi:hypothetical protein
VQAGQHIWSLKTTLGDDLTIENARLYALAQGGLAGQRIYGAALVFNALYLVEF